MIGIPQRTHTAQSTLHTTMSSKDAERAVEAQMKAEAMQFEQLGKGVGEAQQRIDSLLNQAVRVRRREGKEGGEGGGREGKGRRGGRGGIGGGVGFTHGILLSIYTQAQFRFARLNLHDELGKVKEQLKAAQIESLGGVVKNEKGKEEVKPGLKKVRSGMTEGTRFGGAAALFRLTTADSLLTLTLTPTFTITRPFFTQEIEKALAQQRIEASVKKGRDEWMAATQKELKVCSRVCARKALDE
jgi:hypothetical protein